MVVNNKATQTRSRRLVQFSLKSLLLITLLVAAFCAGWVSHRSWQRHQNRNFVQIEFVTEGSAIVSRGRKRDVESVQRVIRELEAPAQQ